MPDEPKIGSNPVKDQIDAIVVTDAEKEKFFKCFLAEQPYTDTIKLFKDKYSVELKTLSVDENNDIIQQVAMDRDRGARNDDAFYIKVLTYRLSVSLLKVNGQLFAPEITKEKYPFNKETGESYVTAKAKALGKWPVFMLTSFQAAFGKFENKVIKLTDLASSPDF